MINPKTVGEAGGQTVGVMVAQVAYPVLSTGETSWSGFDSRIVYT